MTGKLINNPVKNEVKICKSLAPLIKTIIMKINLYNITKDPKDLHLKREIKLEKPYKITSEVADILLDKIFYKKEDISHLMTMYT